MTTTPYTVLGLDLGQAADYTALAAVRAAGESADGRTVWDVPQLRRWPLGTAYPEIVADVAELVAGLDRPALVLDGTGCGRPVLDLFRGADLAVSELVAAVITGGHEVNRVSAEEVHLPKRDLVGCVQSALQGRRLRVPRHLPEGAVLGRELSTFRAKVNIATGNETLEAWRERDHDDMVLALALALWLAEEGPAPDFNIITFDLDGPRVPRPPAVIYDQIRYFAQSGKFQPMPRAYGQTIYGAPDFRSQAEAASFTRRCHTLLGEPPTGDELPDLDAGQAQAVEAAALAFLRAKGLVV